VTARKILFLLRHAPYDGAAAWEALDAMLVAGVFDQSVSVLFLDDAVWQLVPNQDASRIQRRNQAKALTALPDYGVDQLYASADALKLRGLSADTLAVPVQPLTAKEASDLISQQDVVLSG
jgi:tRNA 2-thiouridine synthesizing protein C